MEIKEKLKSRIHLNDILEILFLIRNNISLKQELFELLYDQDEIVSYQTAWVLSHFSKGENKWLFDKQNELINEAMHCKHAGKQRIILQILIRQPINSPPRVDFLNFCFEKIVSRNEPIAIQSSCIKLAYELSRRTPEFLAELKSILEIMELESLTPAIRSVRKNILKVIKI